MNIGSTKRGNPFLLGRNAVTWCQWMSMGEDLFDYQRVDAGSTLWSTIIIAGWPSQEIYTVHMYIKIPLNEISYLNKLCFNFQMRQLFIPESSCER